MNQAIGIIIAGALVAAAIMFTNHWTLSSNGAFLLNRWTGTVTSCVIRTTTPTSQVANCLGGS
jgi:hypothetical protein